MILQRTNLAREALEGALEVREKVGLGFSAPLNIFDLCDRLVPNVRVLFVDYSMEGCYLRSNRPLIKLSALRPLVRRVFNCAHELGHHVFGHGSRIDELQDESRSDPQSNPEEFLADTFAGFLLMPKLGVRKAFTVRGWNIANATPEQVYTVACHFGVGYSTLLTHLAYGLREVSPRRAKELQRVRLPAVRRAILGSDAALRLSVADSHYAMPNLDSEVGTHILLPHTARPDGNDVLAAVDTSPVGRLFEARSPGLVRVEAADGWSLIVRVSKYQYFGWSQYRHLELEEEGHD